MIKINNLTKKFGSSVSLDNVSCEFNKNDAIALMGANGAGKTTLIRSILGYYHPDDGEILIDGLSPIKDRVKVLDNISFVPQLPPPIKLNLDELISYIVTSAKVEKDLIMHYANEMKLDIGANLNKSFFKLSGGMKQKLALSCALIHKPKVLFLDEPTTGVDPVSRKEFWDMLKRLQEKGITILVSTPYMDEAALCDRIALIQDGKILEIDTPENISKRFGIHFCLIPIPVSVTENSTLQLFVLIS